jgi:hypothetical protein
MFFCSLIKVCRGLILNMSVPAPIYTLPFVHPSSAINQLTLISGYRSTHKSHEQT